mgnify:CR=1 FL=1
MSKKKLEGNIENVHPDILEGEKLMTFGQVKDYQKE